MTTNDIFQPLIDAALKKESELRAQIQGAGDDIVKAVISYQKILSPDDRVSLWNQIMANYCRECGDPDPNCQCWNDE